MVSIRQIVLDVMKPFEPDVIKYANALAAVDSVDSVNISLIELDKEVENIKITIEGEGLDYEEIRAEIKKLAGAIHSIDMVVAGKDIIEAQNTPQDGNHQLIGGRTGR